MTPAHPHPVHAGTRTLGGRARPRALWTASRPRAGESAAIGPRTPGVGAAVGLATAALPLCLLLGVAAVSMAGLWVRDPSPWQSRWVTLLTPLRLDEADIGDPRAAFAMLAGAFALMWLLACMGLVAGSLLGKWCVEAMMHPNYLPELARRGRASGVLAGSCVSGVAWTLAACVALGAARLLLVWLFQHPEWIRQASIWYAQHTPPAAYWLLYLPTGICDAGLVDQHWLFPGLPPLAWLVAIALAPGVCAAVRTPAAYRAAVARHMADAAPLCGCGYPVPRLEHCPECGRAAAGTSAAPRWRWPRRGGG